MSEETDITKVTNEDTYLRKGKRVVCEYFRAKPLGTFSLAGMQMKTTGHFVRVTGTIKRVSAEGTPQNPVNIKIELLVEAEEPPCSPTPLPGEESLIGTVVLLSPSTVVEFLT
jgi:hypothetical protein